MFTARSASLCGAARANDVVANKKTSPASRGCRTRGVVHVVAMGRRSKSKKSRNEAEPVMGGEEVVNTAPAQQEQQRAMQAVEQRGPERLSAKDWAEIEAENARARDAMGAAPRPGPAGTGLIDKAFSSDAMLMFGVDGCVPELVNGRVAMLGFVSALITELATGRSFTTQLAGDLRWRGGGIASVFTTAAHVLVHSFFSTTASSYVSSPFRIASFGYRRVVSPPTPPWPPPHAPIFSPFFWTRLLRRGREKFKKVVFITPLSVDYVVKVSHRLINA